MNLTSQKRMAADILCVGQSRVWIDPAQGERVSEAITKQDIRNLIESGIIKKKEKQGTSKGRNRKNKKQKEKGRKKGKGSRKGSKKARSNDKEEWMSKIRALRKRLKELRDNGKIDQEIYRKAYNMAKGGFFRDKNHMEIWIEKNK